MKKQVYIEIVSTQVGADGQKEILSSSVEGNFYEKDGKKYVLYEEKAEGSTEMVKNRLQLTADQMKLKKSGAVNWEASFAQGEKWEADYRTPFGPIPMSVHTRQLEKEEEEDRIKIRVKYRLESAGEHLSECEMDIKIESK